MSVKIVLACAAVLVVFATANAQDKPPPPAADAPAAPHPLEGLWELRMERESWWPNIVPGTLVVSRGPNGLRGSVTFDSMWGIDPKRVAVDSAGDKVRLAVEFGLGEPVAIVTGTAGADVLTGEVDWPGAPSPETSRISAYRLTPQRRFEADSDGGVALPLETDASRVGIDAVSLDRLILYAGRYDTDALVVVKDGRTVCDRTFLRPRCVGETDAVTQGIAALAIPLLVEDGKLPRNLDTPISTWFPEWKADERKARITLRHVLTHASGLAVPDPEAKIRNYLAAALKSSAVGDPGVRIEYNALATALLSGIVSKAAGEQVDAYLARRLFRPLGIMRWEWPHDDAGNAPTHAGLRLNGTDLARIGWLLANDGRWRDKQLLPKWWLDEIEIPSATWDELGLGWALARDPAKETVFQSQERLDRLKRYGFADADKLAPLVGKSFASRPAWWKAAAEFLDEESGGALAELLGRDAVGGELRGPVTWVYLRGMEGQYLL